MALEGSLRDFDLFSLFNMIKTQGKSGTLILARGQEFVKVFFDQGEIVGCDSNQVRVEERLGTMLVRLGRLSGEELMALLQQQRQTLKRMGTLLLESGRVSPQDLQDALFNQAMSIIYRTFRWLEGDYRFDSILPLDLDRENFPAIPVDTVLMEAARVMDEWPEVQRRLPDHKIPIQQTAAAAALSLDIDRELSGVLEGRSGAYTQNGSGLTHEQETMLKYFVEPQSIQSVLQITRYEELETCKIIAHLLEHGLLQAAPDQTDRPAPAWTAPPSAVEEVKAPTKPSGWLYPMVGVALLIPLFTYVPKARSSYNQGLASLQPADVRIVTEPITKTRKAWALRMAAPKDGGKLLGASLGIPLETGTNGIPDFSLLPDPLPELKASLETPPPAEPPTKTTPQKEDAPKEPAAQ